MDWFDHGWLLGPIGYIRPAETGAHYYVTIQTLAMAA
jgi:hypothetical protein